MLKQGPVHVNALYTRVYITGTTAKSPGTGGINESHVVYIGTVHTLDSDKQLLCCRDHVLLHVMSQTARQRGLEPDVGPVLRSWLRS